MLDSVEELGQVNVGGVPAAATNRGSYLLGCSMSRAFRSEPVARFTKVGIEHRCKDLDNGLLEQSIDYVWNTKQSLSAIGFVNGLPPHRTGAVSAIEQLLSNLRPTGSNPVWEFCDVSLHKLIIYLND